MGIVETIALCMGVAWASGINLYATLAMLGLLGASGHMQLPPDLVILQDPIVIAAAGFMYCVEFFADKTPGVDTAWDAVHSFIRIPAAAVLAAGAMGDVSPTAEVAALILGGALGATSHTLKAGTRAVVNTSPEPVSNWGLSIGEDLAVFGGLWAAIYQPTVFLALMVVFLVFAIWALPKVWRAACRVFASLRRLLGGKTADPSTERGQAGEQSTFSLEVDKTIKSLSGPAQDPPQEGKQG